MSFAEAPLITQICYWAMAAIALTVGCWRWFKRWRRAAVMTYPAQQRLKGAKTGWRARLVHLPLGLRLLAVVTLFIALARPQLTEAETAEVEGIDIVVAFDMSGSMEQVDMAEDELVQLQNAGQEPANRFVGAVEVLRNFVKTRQYDRVSLVSFGKEAFLQFPLTLDYGVMLDILGKMKLGDIDGTGTAIGNALAMSVARFKDSEATTQLVILITDGEDNGSKIAPTEMAKLAAEQNIKVFPILVGSEDQTWRPTQVIDLFSRQRRYEKVSSQVNPSLLKEIAETTGGRFYRAADKKSLAEDFVDILDEFEKSRLVDYAAAEKTELFHFFLWPGLLLLMLEVLLSQTVLRRFP